MRFKERETEVGLHMKRRDPQWFFTASKLEPQGNHNNLFMKHGGAKNLPTSK